MVAGINRVQLGTPANFFDLVKLEILAQYGHVVEIDRKSLHKFGRNTNVGTSEVEINALNQNEIYLGSNGITHASSSSAGDTQEIYYEGMTRVGNIYTFVSDTFNLTGQSSIALPTPVSVCTRALDNDGTDLLGNCYFHEGGATTGGIPDDLTEAHNLILAGDNQSLRAGTSIASNNYGILCNAWAFVNKKTTASADIKFKVRPLGGVFRTQAVGSLTTSGGGFQLNFEPYAIIPPNSDVYITAQASTTGVDVSAGFMMFFADIKNNAALMSKTREWL